MHSGTIEGGVLKVRRVLAAIEGADNGDRIVKWRMKHPFNDPVERCV
jgi:hypothetical protein